MSLRYQPEALTITVTDDGRGTADGSADAANGTVAADGGGSSGHGIRGMSERAASVGGSLAAGSRAGGGFQVQAVLPTASGDAPAGRGEPS